MNTKVSCNNNSMVKKDTAFAIGNCFPFFCSHTLNIKVLLKSIENILDHNFYQL